MNIFFSTIAQVNKFKWELDVAANKLGKKWSPEARIESQEKFQLDDPFAFDMNQPQDVSLAHMMSMFEDFADFLLSPHTLRLVNSLETFFWLNLARIM